MTTTTNEFFITKNKQTKNYLVKSKTLSVQYLTSKAIHLTNTTVDVNMNDLHVRKSTILTFHTQSCFCEQTDG